VSSGTRLTTDDLQRDRVRSTTTRPLSLHRHRAGRPGRQPRPQSGDLLPGAALSDERPASLSRWRSMWTTPARPGHGDRIDVYVIPASATAGRPSMVLSAPVASRVGAARRRVGRGEQQGAADRADPAATGPDETDVVARLAAGSIYLVQRVGPAGRQDQAGQRIPATPRTPARRPHPDALMPYPYSRRSPERSGRSSSSPSGPGRHGVTVIRRCVDLADLLAAGRPGAAGRRCCRPTCVAWTGRR